MHLFATSLLMSVALAQVSNITVPDGFNAYSPDPAKIEVSTISYQKATELFRTFSEQKQIPFKYPIDGCYARATEMSRISEKQGVKMARVYSSGQLQVKTDLPKYPLVQWGWHVAPDLSQRPLELIASSRYI